MSGIKKQVAATVDCLLRFPFLLAERQRRLTPGLGFSCFRKRFGRYFEVVAGSPLVPGVVAAIQTFGDRINLHPHLHFLVTEGGVDETGVFHKIPRLDDSRLAALFAREVLADLVRKELLSPEWAERVGKYMIRPLLALERLFFLEKEGKVGYRHGQDGSYLCCGQATAPSGRLSGNIPVLISLL